MGFKFEFKTGQHTGGAEEDSGTAETGRTAETRRDADTDAAAPASGEETGNSETIVSSPVLGRAVEVPYTAPEIPQPAKRGRKPGATSPKSISKSSSKSDVKDLENNLSLLTSGLYSMTGKLLNVDYFELKPEEAQSIAAPLAKILDRMAITSTLNKYGDGLALVAAVTIITAPKISRYVEEKKQNDGRKIIKATESTGSNRPNSPEIIGQSPLDVSDNAAYNSALYT